MSVGSSPSYVLKPVMPTKSPRGVPVASFADWMDSLDLRCPIPALLPTKNVAALSQDTVCWSQKQQTASSPSGRQPAALSSLSPKSSSSLRDLRTSFGSPTSSTALKSSPVLTSGRRHSTSVVMERSTRTLDSSDVDDLTWNRPHIDKLRNQLRTFFREDRRVLDYFTYLVAYGSNRARPELAPERLQHEDHQLLGLLFGVLDTNSDGFVEADDIATAAACFHEDVGEYTKASFRKLDRQCVGKVDFEGFLLAFFPNHTLRSLQLLRKSLEKPMTKLWSTKELLQPQDLAEAERNFQFFHNIKPVNTPDGKPGCSLTAYLSVLKDPEHQAIAEADFAKQDSDADGILNFDEFLEVVKLLYPPFKRASHTSANSGPGVAEAAGEWSSAGELSNSNNKERAASPHVLEHRRMLKQIRDVEEHLVVVLPQVVPQCVLEAQQRRRINRDKSKASEALECIAQMREAEAKARVLLR